MPNSTKAQFVLKKALPKLSGARLFVKHPASSGGDVKLNEDGGLRRNLARFAIG
jgi:hypothetical protein